jgi:hypothetical protein
LQPTCRERVREKTLICGEMGGDWAIAIAAIGGDGDRDRDRDGDDVEVYLGARRRP